MRPVSASVYLTQDVRTLEPDKVIERELFWGEAHSYQVALPRGQYLRVVVVQRINDLSITLFGPDGRQITECDSRWYAQEPVSVIAAVAGHYRLVVRAREKLIVPENYVVKIEELRPARPSDETRIAAERISTAAKQLLLEGTAGARPEAIKQYEEALALWRRLGDRAEEAQSLHTLGYLHHASFEPRKALDYYQQALTMRQDLGDLVGEAQTLHNIAAAYSSLFSLTEAEKHYEQALERRRAAADRRGEAQTLSNLGFIYFSRSKRRQALECLDQSLSLARALGDALAEAHALVNLGAVANLKDGPRKALDYFLQAIPLARAAADRQTESAALNNLGRIYSGWGETRKALDCFEQALPLSETLGDRRTQAIVLNNLGSLYSWMGEAQKAREHYTKALRLARDANDPRSEATVLNNLSSISTDLGEWQKALEYFEQSLKLSRKLNDRQLEATTLNSAGKAYDELGQPQKAFEYLTQAQQIFHDLGDRPGEAQTLSNLGVIHTNRGEPQKSLDYFQQSLAIWQAKEDQRSEAYTLNHLGGAYHSSGEKQQALDCHLRALRLSQAVGDRLAEAYSLSSLGVSYAALGEKQQAREAYGQALALWRAMSNPWRQAITLGNLAAVERDLGELDAARSDVEAALKIVESLRARIASQELRASYFASAQSSYHLYLDLLAQLDQQRPTAGFAAAALHASERARARSLLELLTEERLEINQGRDPALKERERANQTRLSWLNTQLSRERAARRPDEKKIATLTAELKQAESERERLEMEIRVKIPQYAEIFYPEPLRSEAIQALLDDQTSLLEYALGDDESFLFVVSRDGARVYRLPRAAEIERQVEKLRAALARPGRQSFGDYVQASRQLYQMLIAPASGTIAGKRRLLIAPAGKLYYLPFEALLTEDPRTGGQADYRALAYLLRRWTISYAPSASVLASLRQHQSRLARQDDSGAVKQFVGFADPVYEDKLPRLIDSGREVGRIAQLFPRLQTAIYSRGEATEENVKRNPDPGRARYLHFSTHGIINQAQPQNSALALTPNVASAEDGRLYVNEIFDLKLNAELVVLSACDTGLGQELKGEGVIGLTRAFLYAGSSSVVVSLWQVADRSTSEMMVKFYRRLNRPADKAEALRQAKLEMIETGYYAHPHCWAPFVLMGEPNQ